jgi:hypothetical protein
MKDQSAIFDFSSIFVIISINLHNMSCIACHEHDNSYCDSTHSYKVLLYMFGV